jgi:hypothetical protein
MNPLLPRTDDEWTRVRTLAASLGSDGCTGVSELYHPCCELHDCLYRTGVSWRDGTPVTRAHADQAFRQCMQQRSPFKAASPVAWLRWLGVRLFGRMRGTSA